VPNGFGTTKIGIFSGFPNFLEIFAAFVGKLDPETSSG
jgi:hypothetical protein